MMNSEKQQIESERFSILEKVTLSTFLVGVASGLLLYLFTHIIQIPIINKVLEFLLVTSIILFIVQGIIFFILDIVKKAKRKEFGKIFKLGLIVF